MPLKNWVTLKNEYRVRKPVGNSNTRRNTHTHTHSAIAIGCSTLDSPVNRFSRFYRTALSSLRAPSKVEPILVNERFFRVPMEPDND